MSPPTMVPTTRLLTDHPSNGELRLRETNRELAEAWVKFLLSDVGRGIMEKNGQPAIAPATTEQFDRLPASLQPLCKEIGSTG